MNQEVIQPKKEVEQIKVVGLLHFIGNILSGGILGTVLVVVYMFITDNLQSKTKQAIYGIINFNVSFFIYISVSFLLMFILIGFITTPILILIWFISLVIGFIKHLAGESYKYPMSITFLK